MPTICHVTTVHQSDDVRIYERECRSLATLPGYRVVIVGAGSLPEGSAVEHVALPPRPTNRAKRILASQKRAFSATREVDADVYHFHDPELLPVALLLARHGKQIVWDAHENYEEQLSVDGAKDWVPGPVRNLTRSAMTKMLDLVDARAAGIVAATPDIADRYHNPRTMLVGNESRLEDFAACAPDFGSKRVLFTGQPHSRHCFPEVVDAVAALPDLTLTLAGRQPTTPAWQEALAELGDRLEYFGWLDRAALCRAMSQSAVGVVAYDDRPTHQKNSPNKIFEFAAAGLPIVSTPNASIRAMVEQGGFGVVAAGYAARDLEAALREALSDRERWQQMSDAARGWAQAQGTWEKSEAQLFELYRAIAPPTE